MKKLLISATAAALVMSFAVSAEAAGSKQKVSAGRPDFVQSSSGQEILRDPLLEAA
ncbi:MAG: hypothetical protein WA753_04685 [Pseudolabrys sp.]